MRESSQRSTVMPQFQLCSDDFSNFARLARIPDNVLVSPKLDGFRCGATFGTHLCRSRSGLPFPLGLTFASDVWNILGAIEHDILGVRTGLDCELTHPDGIEVLREIVQGQMDTRYDELVLNVFDIFLPDTLLSIRTEILASAFDYVQPDDGPGSVRLVEHTPLTGPLTEENLDRIRDRFVADGYEGAVFKVADAPYLPGLSPFWLRRVPFQSVDLPVVGWKKSPSGRLVFLTCDAGEALVNVAVGFTAEQRVEFAAEPPDVVEVFHRGITRKGSLRNPVFRRPRPDKAVHGGN